MAWETIQDGASGFDWYFYKRFSVFHTKLIIFPLSKGKQMLLFPVPDFDTVMDNLLKKIMWEVCFYTILYFRATDTKSVRTRNIVVINSIKKTKK